jgi:hypothetical protein
MPDVPVSVVLPDEAKRPPWLAPAVAASVKNPRFEGAGLWTVGARDGSERLVRDTSERGAAQFGHYWASAPAKYMDWFELWATARDAKGGSDRRDSEAAVVRAIEKFARQNGVDPWGFTFETTFDEATVMTKVAQEHTMVFKTGADLTGDRRRGHAWGQTHRRQEQVPRPPTLSHVLVGGGYGLIHLLVAKNMPRALRCLLQQKTLFEETSTAAGGKGKKGSEASAGGAPLSEEAIDAAAAAVAAAVAGPTTTDATTLPSGEEAAATSVTLSSSSSPPPPQSEQGVVERRSVNVDQLSAQQETPLALARSLGFIDCAKVLEAAGARMDPAPTVTWLDVWRAIADLDDQHAVEVTKRFRRQKSLDKDGFGLDYQRMSRPERKDYTGLRGHEWWGYAQETLGWTLAHMACAKDKPRCLAELAAAGANLNVPAMRSSQRYNELTPLMIARQKGHARCIAVLMDPTGSAGADYERRVRPAVANIKGELGRDRLCEATSLPRNASQYPPPPPPAFAPPPPPVSTSTGLLGVCPSHLASPLSYQQLWDAIDKEPEQQATRKLRIFLQQTSPDAVEATLRRRRLTSFDDFSGFTLAHLAAHRMQWGTLLFLFRAMRPSDRGLANIEGQTALQIARQKRLLSATCLPQRATTGAREPSSEAEESEARAFELLEDLIGNGGDVSRTSLRRGS